MFAWDLSANIIGCCSERIKQLRESDRLKRTCHLAQTEWNNEPVETRRSTAADFQDRNVKIR